MKGQIREAFQPLPPYVFEDAHNIPPDNISDAAKNDQKDGHDVDDGVMDIGCFPISRPYPHCRMQIPR